MFATVEFGYTVALSVVNVCCIAGNILSARIFCNDQFKTKIFRYLTWNSIVDAALLTVRILLPFVDSPALPVWSASYFVRAYKLYVITYAARSLDLLSSVLSIRISIERLVLLKSNEITPTPSRQDIKRAEYLVIALPFVLFMPALFFQKVSSRVAEGRSIGSNDTASVFYIEYLNRSLGAIFINHILHFFVYFITLGTMFVLNLMLICKIRQLGQYLRLSTNSRTKSSSNAKTKINSQTMKRRSLSMVIWITSIYSIGHLTFTIATLVNIFSVGNYHCFTNGLVLFLVHLCEILSHGLGIFIYTQYNRTFASVLRRMVPRFSKIIEQNPSNDINCAMLYRRPKGSA
jgi:hypothetical protein